MSRTRVPTPQRARILNRDGHRCLWCGRSPTSDGVTLDVDHVLPEAFKGKTTDENLGTLCSVCNNGKGAEYYGDYLLTTIMEVGGKLDTRALDAWIKDETLEGGLDDGQHYDAQVHRVSIPFHINDGLAFPLNDRIYSTYRIHGSLLGATFAAAEIIIELSKTKAFREVKDRLRDYLIRNRGYLKLVAGRLVFYERARQE